jgi:hypothetical protein
MMKKYKIDLGDPSWQVFLVFWGAGLSIWDLGWRILDWIGYTLPFSGLEVSDLIES